MIPSRAVAAFVLLCATACSPTSTDEEVVGSTAAPSEPVPPPEQPGNPADVLALFANQVGGCGLQRAGTVACWGENGTSHVNGLDDAVAIATAGRGGCAIRRDGSVVCWGDDNLLAEVEGVREATALFGGSGSTCALTTSGVQCWGTAVPAFATIGYLPPGPTRLELEGVRGLYLGPDPAVYFEDGRVMVWEPDEPEPSAHVPAGPYSTFEECLREIDGDPELMRDCRAMLMAEPESAPPPKLVPKVLTDVVEVYSDNDVVCQVRTSGDVACREKRQGREVVIEVVIANLRGARQLVHTHSSSSHRILGIRPDGTLVGMSMTPTIGRAQQNVPIDDFNDVSALVHGDEIFGIRRGRVYGWALNPDNPRHYKSRELTLPAPPSAK